MLFSNKSKFVLKFTGDSGAKAEDKKAEKEESEEEDDDMGFGLFD